jgi:hypothetical protein
MVGNTLTVKECFEDLVGNTCQRIVTGNNTRSGIIPTPVVLASHDLNDNGKTDVIWQNTNSETVAVWLMNGLIISSTGVPSATPTDWNIQD